MLVFTKHLMSWDKQRVNDTILINHRALPDIQQEVSVMVLVEGRHHFTYITIDNRE